MLYHVAVSLNDVKDIEDPLNKVEAGLVGGDIPLQSVHIKAKLIDLAAQVILLTLIQTCTISPCVYRWLCYKLMRTSVRSQLRPNMCSHWMIWLLVCV